MENNENEVSLTDSTVMSQSEIQSTPMSIKESSLTESVIMGDVGVHSTPISTKESNKSDYIMSVLRTISSNIDNINRHFVLIIMMIV